MLCGTGTGSPMAHDLRAEPYVNWPMRGEKKAALVVRGDFHLTLGVMNNGYSEDSINAAFQPDQPDPRLCVRCLTIAQQGGVLLAISPEEPEGTAARYMREAFGMLDHEDLQVGEVLRSAEHIAQQDPDLAAELRRAARRFSETILDLRARMDSDDA